MCAYQPKSTVSDCWGEGGYLLLHQLDENKLCDPHSNRKNLANINGLSTYTNIYSVKLITIIYRRSWCFHIIIHAVLVLHSFCKNTTPLD